MLSSSEDLWVLEAACRDLKKWLEQGLHPMRVSVNISAVQFRNEHFVSELRNILEQTQVARSLLCLEITESTALEDLEYSHAICKEIADLGVQLHLDDFGTGYSSFSLLKQVKLDAIKIDRSFVQEIDHNNQDAAIVKAIVTMAKELNLTIVAEGVEEARQWEKLREMGCDLIQGYYISKPLPENELIAFAKQLMSQ